MSERGPLLGVCSALRKAGMISAEKRPAVRDRMTRDVFVHAQRSIDEVRLRRTTLGRFGSKSRGTSNRSWTGRRIQMIRRGWLASKATLLLTGHHRRRTSQIIAIRHLSRTTSRRVLAARRYGTAQSPLLCRVTVETAGPAARMSALRAIAGHKLSDRESRMSLPLIRATRPRSNASSPSPPSAVSGAAGFGPPPVNRSITERTASRVLRSFTRIEQRRGARRAADQAFRIGKHQGIVPRALHHEGQFKCLVAGGGGRRQAGDALEVVFARRHRSRAGQGQARRRPVDADVLDGGDAVVEAYRNREIVVRRRTASADCRRRIAAGAPAASAVARH